MGKWEQEIKPQELTPSGVSWLDMLKSVVNIPTKVRGS